MTVKETINRVNEVSRTESATKENKDIKLKDRGIYDE